MMQTRAMKVNRAMVDGRRWGDCRRVLLHACLSDVIVTKWPDSYALVASTLSTSVTSIGTDANASGWAFVQYDQTRICKMFRSRQEGSM